MGHRRCARAARPYAGAGRSRRRQDERRGPCPAGGGRSVVGDRRRGQPRRDRGLEGAGRHTAALIGGHRAHHHGHLMPPPAGRRHGHRRGRSARARRRQRRPLAVPAVLHNPVQPVLGRAPATVQLGGLDPRPPQRLRAPFGQLARRALAVRGGDRHLQPGVAHDRPPVAAGRIGLGQPHAGDLARRGRQRQLAQPPTGVGAGELAGGLAPPRGGTAAPAAAVATAWRCPAASGAAAPSRADRERGPAGSATPTVAAARAARAGARRRRRRSWRASSARVPRSSRAPRSSRPARPDAPSSPPPAALRPPTASPWSPPPPSTPPLPAGRPASHATPRGRPAPDRAHPGRCRDRPSRR